MEAGACLRHKFGFIPLASWLQQSISALPGVRFRHAIQILSGQACRRRQQGRKRQPSRRRCRHAAQLDCTLTTSASSCRRRRRPCHPSSCPRFCCRCWWWLWQRPPGLLLPGRRSAIGRWARSGPTGSVRRGQAGLRAVAASKACSHRQRGGGHVPRPAWAHACFAPALRHAPPHTTPTPCTVPAGLHCPCRGMLRHVQG